METRVKGKLPSTLIFSQVFGFCGYCLLHEPSFFPYLPNKLLLPAFGCFVVARYPHGRSPQRVGLLEKNHFNNSNPVFPIR